MTKIENRASIKPMSQSQSIEALNATNAAPAVRAIDPRGAVVLLDLAQSIAGLDAKIAELQSQLDTLPAQETALTEDRSKPPAEVRAGLAGLHDRRSDLKLELKRQSDDRTAALTKARALFPTCTQLLQRHFSSRHDSLKARAVEALDPFFFPGAPKTPEMIAADLPSVARAATEAAYAHERVKGDTAEESLQKHIAAINEFGLDKIQSKQ